MEVMQNVAHSPEQAGWLSRAPGEGSNISKRATVQKLNSLQPWPGLQNKTPWHHHSHAAMLNPELHARSSPVTPPGQVSPAFPLTPPPAPLKQPRSQPLPPSYRETAASLLGDSPSLPVSGL